METTNPHMAKIRELMYECINQEDQDKFLNDCHDRLNGRPIDLLKTEEGRKKVEDLLEGMIWGDFL